MRAKAKFLQPRVLIESDALHRREVDFVCVGEVDFTVRHDKYRG